MPQKNITKELETLRVGDYREFPAEKSTSVRSMASMLGFKWNKVFKTFTDRDRRIIVVTRHS